MFNMVAYLGLMVFWSVWAVATGVPLAFLTAAIWGAAAGANYVARQHEKKVLEARKRAHELDREK